MVLYHLLEVNKVVIDPIIGSLCIAVIVVVCDELREFIQSTIPQALYTNFNTSPSPTYSRPGIRLEIHRL